MTFAAARNPLAAAHGATLYITLILMLLASSHATIGAFVFRSHLSSPFEFQSKSCIGGIDAKNTHLSTTSFEAAVSTLSPSMLITFEDAKHFRLSIFSNHDRCAVLTATGRARCMNRLVITPRRVDRPLNVLPTGSTPAATHPTPHRSRFPSRVVS